MDIGCGVCACVGFILLRCFDNKGSTYGFKTVFAGKDVVAERALYFYARTIMKSSI